MALIVADRVQETTNSTGTGAYTLGGAVPGFQTFASEVSNTDTVYYSVSDNVNFEVGLGTYASSGGTITRTAVFTSSNSNNAVNWGIGTKNIFLTYPADKAVLEDASNNVTVGNNLVVGGTVDGRDVAADGTKLDYISVTQAVNLDQMETDIAALENGMVYKGDWNAGSGSFPGGGSAQTGWFYYVSGAGTVNSISFAVGDNIVATTDNASASTYANNWSKHDQTDAVQAVVGLTGSVSKSGLLSALNVEDGADVTDTGNVNPLVDSHINVGSAGSGQYLGWTGSDYNWSAIDLSTKLNLSGGTMSGDIDGNGNKVLFANVYSQLSDLPSASTYHGMFAHVHATGKGYYAHAGNWIVLANESTTLALSGGAMTGAITTNSTFDGRDVATDGTKLDGIEASADVTDTANVTSAGALMDSELTNLAAVKAINQSLVTTASPTFAGLNASGNLTLDVAGEINLDADTSGVIRLKDGGTEYGTLFSTSSNFLIKSQGNDKDIIFQGNDSGGSGFTALTLDMSSAGRANFNNDIGLNDDRGIRFGSDDDSVIYNDGSNLYIKNGTLNQDIIFQGNDDGSSNTTALTLDMSDAGTAIFNHNIKLPDNGGVTFGAGSDLSIYSDGTNGVVNVTNGDLTLDVVGDIILDVDGAEIFLKDGGVQFASFYQNSNNFYIQSSVSDKDIIFQGNDGGTGFTALTLDMSDAGRATFNSGVNLGAGIRQQQNSLTMSGGTSTIDLASANNHYATMTANTTVAFSNKDSGRQGNIIFKQDATGGRTFTLPSECKTPVNGETIVQATGANEISILSYYVLDSSNILVNYIGDFA